MERTFYIPPVVNPLTRKFLEETYPEEDWERILQNQLHSEDIDWEGILNREKVMLFLEDKRKIMDWDVEISSKVGPSGYTISALEDWTSSTRIDRLVAAELLVRGWNQIMNPSDASTIGFAWSAGDINPTISKSAIVEWKNMPNKDKLEFAEYLADKKRNRVRTGELTYREEARKILAKAYISNRLAKVTRWISNKASLYNLIQARVPYSDKFIPITEEFKRTWNEPTEKDKIALAMRVDKMLNTGSDTYILKPSSGSGSKGFGVFSRDQFTVENILDWIQDPQNNLSSELLTGSAYYESWLMSQFLFSIPAIIQGDTVGRIAKFRVYGIMILKNKKLYSYLYRNILASVAALEVPLTPEGLPIIPEDIDKREQIYNPDEADEVYWKAATGNDLTPPGIWTKLPQIMYKIRNNIATPDDLMKLEVTVRQHLDLSWVIRNSEEYSRLFPTSSQEDWNGKVIPGLKRILKGIREAMGSQLVCLGGYSRTCFQYMAMDIIIDHQSRPWLLEANTRPWSGFGEWWKKYDPNYRHVQSAPQFVRDIMNLVLDNTRESWIKAEEYNIEANEEEPIYADISPANETPGSVYYIMDSILDAQKWRPFPWPDITEPDFLIKGQAPLSKIITDSNLPSERKVNLLKALYPNLTKVKVTNRLPTLRMVLGNKDALASLFDESGEGVVPSGFIFDPRKSDPTLVKKIRNSGPEKWIAKPALGQQGSGVLIFDKDDDINELIIHINNEAPDEKWVVSQYIDPPLLINGHKCHIRVYVLVVVDQTGMKVYVFRDQILFLTAKPYGSCKSEDKDLCNLSNLQIAADYYESIGKSRAEAYKEFTKPAEYTIDELFGRGYYNSKIRPVIDRSINEVLYRSKDEIKCLNPKGICFRYTAFDFLPAQNGYPYLLEVNSTPGMKAPGQVWEAKGGVKYFLQQILHVVMPDKVKSKGKNLWQEIKFSPIKAKPGKPRAKPGRPRAKQGRPRAKPGRPRAKQGRPRAKPGRPRAKQGRPRAKPGRPRAKPGRPRAKQGRPRAKPGRPRAKQGRPRAKQSRPRAKQSRSGTKRSLFLCQRNSYIVLKKKLSKRKIRGRSKLTTKKKMCEILKSTHTFMELKNILKKHKIKGRSKARTKREMVKLLKKYKYL